MPRAPRQAIWLMGAVVAGLLLGVASWRWQDAVTADSFEYMRGGVGLWAREGYRSMSGDPQVTFPPFYPLLIGAVDRLVHDPVRAGRLVSLVASTASILLLWLVAAHVVGRGPALVAAWLYALLPLRVTTSTMVWSESTYVWLLLAGLILFLAAQRRASTGLLCGVVFGAAYLTRPEAVVALGLMVLVWLIVWRSCREERAARPWVWLLSTMVGFAVLAAPYVVYLHHHTGRWQVTGKATAFLAAASAVDDRGFPMASTKVLSDDGSAVVRVRHPVSPRSLAVRAANNGRRALLRLTDALSPFLILCLGMALAGGGAPWCQWRRALPVIAALVIPLPLVVVLHFEERFLLVPAILLLILATWAPWAMGGREDGVGGHRHLRAALLLGLGAVWMLGRLALLGAAAEPGLSVTLAPAVAALRRHERARGPVVGNFPASALAFQTHRDCLMLPWAPPERVLPYADRHQASFLLVGTQDHPDLATLAEHPVETARLVPLARAKAGPAAAGHRTQYQLYYIRPLRPSMGAAQE